VTKLGQGPFSNSSINGVLYFFIESSFMNDFCNSKLARNAGATKIKTPLV